MGPRSLLRLIQQVFGNLYFLMFLNGFLLASFFYFKVQSAYEDGLFASIKNTIDASIDSNDTPDSVAVKAMDVCYHLMNNRHSTFADADANNLGLAGGIFQSTAVDLMTTRGACGSYSQVLARTLKTFHYPVRIAQMKAQGHYGAHNIVEVQIGQKWVVLDPTYNLKFIRPDDKLASFDDVHSNWSYYSRQVPSEYNRVYAYEDVRYTNWTKIPVISPALRYLLSIFIGPERTNSFSLRTMFMNTYTVYMYVVMLLYIPLLLVTLRRLVKTKIFPSPEIPVTFSNIMKYGRLRTQQKATYTL